MVKPVRSRATRTLALACGLILTAGLSLTTVPTAGAATAGASSSAAPPISRSVSVSTTVKSSTGKKLKVSLYAYVSRGIANLSVSLNRGNETHSWSFPIATSSVKISTKALGTVKVPAKKLGGYGTLSVKIKSAGKLKKSRCGGKVYNAWRSTKLAGKFFFDSKSGWGKVGSKKKARTFKSARTSLYYDVTCPPGPERRPVCVTQISWSGYHSTGSGYRGMYATKSGSTTWLAGSRSTRLAKPKNAYRYDSVSAKAAAPKLTVRADDTARIAMKGSRGSAAANSSGPGYDYTTPCRTGTQHDFSWNGSLSNAKTPIRLKAQVYGDFTLPNGTAIYFSKRYRTA